MADILGEVPSFIGRRVGGRLSRRTARRRARAKVKEEEAKLDDKMDELPWKDRAYPEKVAGNEGVAGGDADSEDGGWLFETANTTSKKSMKRWIARTKADVVFVQEHGVLRGKTCQLKTWAARRGWQCVISPALAAQGKAVRAGTAIFARQTVGLAELKGVLAEVVPGRLVVAVVALPNWPRILVGSIYLVAGAALQPANRQILAEWAKLTQRTSMPTLLACDFQMPAEALLRSGYAEKLGAQVVKPPKGVPTCVTSRGSSQIDYFITSLCLARARRGNKVISSFLATHRPHRMEFPRKAEDTLHLTQINPPVLPIDFPMGPVFRTQDFKESREAARKAHEIAKGAPPKVAAKFLDEAYRVLADESEKELAAATGKSSMNMGMRSRQRQVVWQPIVQKDRPTTDRVFYQDRVDGWKWLAERAKDLTRLYNRAAEGTLSGFSAEVAGQWGESMLQEEPPTEQTHDDITAELAVYRGLLRSAADQFAEGAGEDQRETWNQEAAQSIEKINVATALSLKEALREGDANWEEWVDQAFKRGAKTAHRWTKLDEQWATATLESDKAEAALTLQEMVDEDADALAECWDASCDPAPFACPRFREAGPRLTPEELRQASKSFPDHTSIAGDGFHPKHFRMLPDEALLAISDLLSAIELLGFWPSLLRTLAMPLIQKPKGGRRAVTTFPSLYRLWTRARRNVVREWRQTLDRSYLAYGPEKSAQQVVWRQAAQAEFDGISGRKIAAILLDLQKFFERIPLSMLRERAIQAGVPAWLVNAAVAMYSGARVLSLNGVLARSKLYALNGLPAGCSLADIWITTFSVPGMDVYQRLAPFARVAIWFDDFALTCGGKTEEQLLNAIVLSLVLLIDILWRAFAAKIAFEKTACITNAPGVWEKAARMVEAAFPDQGVVLPAAAPCASNLGVDHMVGRPRRVRKKSAKTVRTCKAKRRAQKIMECRAMAKRGRQRFQRIVTIGLLPAASYGARVWGLSAAEARSMRSLSLAALVPTCQASLCAKLVLHGDPVARVAYDVVIGFVAEVWSTMAGVKTTSVLSIPTLVSFWNAARPDMKRKLSECRGPVQIAGWTLRELGWKWEQPLCMTTNGGQTLKMADNSPKAFGHWLEKDMLAQHDLRLRAKAAARIPADKVDMKKVYLEEGPIMVEPVRAFIAKASPEARGCLQKLWCDGLWTKSDYKKAGHDIDEVCPRCGEQGDSVFHRAWLCAETQCKIARAKAAPQWFLSYARNVGKDDPLFNNGWITCPAFLEPADLATDIRAENADGEEISINDVKLEGPVFVDGSCSRETLGHLNRASWSVVMMPERPPWKPTVTVMGPVWRSVAQTPQAGEQVGAAVVFQLLSGKATIHSDCSNVVADHACPELAVRRGGLHAGTVRSTLAGDHSLAEVEKVKAHRDLGEIAARAPGSQEHFLAVGNDYADKAAKRAQELHPQPSRQDRTVLANRLNWLQMALRVFAVTLPLFPRCEAQLAKREPVQTRHKSSHKWKKEIDMWTCTRCWLQASALCYKASRLIPPSACSPMPPVFQRLRDRIGPGHQPLAFGTDHGVLVICGRCAAYSHVRARRLYANCPGSTGLDSRSEALARLARGRHPTRPGPARLLNGNALGEPNCVFQPAAGFENAGAPQETAGDAVTGHSPCSRRLRGKQKGTQAQDIVAAPPGS